MQLGYLTAPSRHTTRTAATASSAVSKKTAVENKTSGATRPPMHPQRKPARAVARANEAVGAAATPAETETNTVVDAEKKVQDLMLAFLRRPDVGRLYLRERTLFANISAVVRQLVAERDEARLELHDLREQAKRAYLSSVDLTHAEGANNDGDIEETHGVEELEDKPEPTMWQLIAAGYANDPELADAWSDLLDDPAFADLHEPAICALATQMRAQLRLDHD